MHSEVETGMMLVEINASEADGQVTKLVGKCA